MKKTILLVFALGTLLTSCGKSDTQIAENTFIHGNKIYKIIDNEVREIGDLSGDIKKFEALKPKQRDFGEYSLAYIKPGASASLKALYRGNFLYYTLTIERFNDLKERNPYSGHFTIAFLDEYGFILHSTDVALSDLTGVVGEDGKLLFYRYSGKTEMSTEISLAISRYDVSAAVAKD